MCACFLATTFKTALTAAAAKVKACHHPLQVSDVAIQVYPALQLMQVKVLPIKFWGWKFYRQPVDCKTLKFTFLEIFYIAIQYIWQVLCCMLHKSWQIMICYIKQTHKELAMAGPVLCHVKNVLTQLYHFHEINDLVWFINLFYYTDRIYIQVHAKLFDLIPTQIIT